jgi:hypothetical protein
MASIGVHWAVSLHVLVRQYQNTGQNTIARIEITVGEQVPGIQALIKIAGPRTF